MLLVATLPNGKQTAINLASHYWALVMWIENRKLQGVTAFYTKPYTSEFAKFLR